MSSRIRITWFPKQNRGVIDCLFRLRGRDDIHVDFKEDTIHSAVDYLDLGKDMAEMVNEFALYLFSAPYWGKDIMAESIVVELKVGE